MSLQRYQRAFRAIGGYSGGTSRLARPPQRLLERDIRPFPPHFCDPALLPALVELPAPDPVPEGTVQTFGWCGSTGTHLAIGMSVSPWLAVYKRTGNTLGNRLTVPSPPTSTVFNVDWDPTGTYLAVMYGSSPDNRKIRLWSRSGDTLTRLTDGPVPGSLTLPINWIRWSPGGGHLVASHASSTSSSAENLATYSFSGGTLTHLGNLSISEAGSNAAIRFAWDPTGTWIVGGYQGTTALFLVKRVGSTFTVLTDPPAVAAGGNAVKGFAWTPDSAYALVAADGAQLSVYPRSGDSLTTPTDHFLTTAGKSIAVRTQSASVAMITTPPVLHLIEQSGTTLTDTTPTYTATNTNGDLRWTEDGEFLAAATSGFRWWGRDC